EDMRKLLQGVYLSEGHVRATRVKMLRKQGESAWLEIVLREGKNREIRRMLARLEHKVMRLKRIGIGPLRLKGAAVGKARPLKSREVRQLREAARRSEKDSAVGDD